MYHVNHASPVQHCNDAEVLAEFRGQWESPRVLATFRTSTPPQRRRHDESSFPCRRPSDSTPLRTIPVQETTTARVEDRLLDYQRQHDARMLFLKQQQESREEVITFTPKVNHRSRKLAEDRPGNVHDRLSAPPPPPMCDRSDQDVQPENNERRRSGTPTINKRSKAMPKRGPQAQEQWERERRQRLEAQREAQERDVSLQCSGKPTIDTKSRKFVDRVGVFVDPLQLVLPVEDRLLRKHQEVEQHKEELRERHWQAIQQQSVHSGGSFQQQHRTTLAKEASIQDASTRLFMDAEERRRAREETLRQVEFVSLVDQSNGQLLFTPHISSSTPSTVRSTSATRSRNNTGHGDIFSYLAEERLEKDRIEVPRSANDNPKPKIGAYSALLAELVRPTDVDTFQRLSTETLKKTDNETNSVCTFHPKLDKRSVALDRSRVDSKEDRINLLMQKHAASEANISRMQQEKADQEALEAQRLDEQRKQKIAVRPTTPDATYRRMVAWAHRTEHRVSSIRSRNEEDTLQECTFTPRTNTNWRPAK